ncbi:hypothetical protein [Schleiferilactobacillus harbinensis]|jgi:hypothetical protein|uniref:hypothetical protein n=1 Tax=Schleiferilactobacillus harbinensis TaxID=304207 RepID=UPI002671F1CE|nr:hypothetical protein [Schleiferilactobacillus harbinensis]
MKAITEVTPQNKLVLIRGRKEAQATMPVFIPIELHEKLKQLSADTNLSMKEIVDTMIRWAMDNLIVADSDGRHV